MRIINIMNGPKFVNVEIFVYFKEKKKVTFG